MSAALILCLALVSFEGASAFGCCRRNFAPRPSLNPLKIVANPPPPAANKVVIRPPVGNEVTIPPAVANTVEVQAKHPKTLHNMVEKKVEVKPLHNVVKVNFSHAKS